MDTMIHRPMCVSLSLRDSVAQANSFIAFNRAYVLPQLYSWGAKDCVFHCVVCLRSHHAGKIERPGDRCEGPPIKGVLAATAV